VPTQRLAAIEAPKVCDGCLAAYERELLGWCERSSGALPSPVALLWLERRRARSARPLG